MDHGATIAHLVMDAAKELGTDKYLNVVVANCNDLDPGSFGKLDFVWLDGISTDDRFEELYKASWRGLKLGVHAAVHSTLTNTTSKAWLGKVRSNEVRICTIRAPLPIATIFLTNSSNPFCDSLRSSQIYGECREARRLRGVSRKVLRLRT